MLMMVVVVLRARRGGDSQRVWGVWSGEKKRGKAGGGEEGKGTERIVLMISVEFW